MLLNSADQHYAQTVDQKLPEEKNNQADTNHAHCHIPVKNIGGQNQNLEGWKECFAGEWLWLCSVLSCRLIYWSDSKSDVVMFGGLVTARMGKSILSWRLFIWVMAVFRKKLQESYLGWTIDVAVVDAVLKLSMNQKGYVDASQRRSKSFDQCECQCIL